MTIKLSFLKILFLLWFLLSEFSFTPLSGQNYFKIIGGIPHLPAINPSAISSPENGMLVFSSVDAKPLIYSGSDWETLCTNNISTTTPQDYFVVKNGIPYLPSLNSSPSNPQPGSVYYSIADKAIMIYNGSVWKKMVELTSVSISDNNGFASGSNVSTYKLPVLNSNPSPTGLTAGAIYINSISKTIRYFDGTKWKDVACFPIILTLPITNYTTGYTASGGGDVLENGGSDISLTGICWSPYPNPDTTLISKTKQIPSGNGIGQFISSLTNLVPNTTYYVRAYAVNSQGITYGDNVTFKNPLALASIITLPADSITNMRAVSGGDITADGGAPVTKRGIIWSALGDPQTDPAHITTDDGSGVGSYRSTLSHLLGNTTYYIRAYAINSEGTAYGNLIMFSTPAPIVAKLDAYLTIDSITGNSAVGTSSILNNGGAPITDKGICYTINHSDYHCVSSATISNTGAFVTKLTGLAEGTTYYAKAYATNNAGTGYGPETSFVTAAHLSVLTTKPSNILGTTAKSGGIISGNGFSNVTAKGVCWSVTNQPAIETDSLTSESITGDGTSSFTSSIIKLSPGTKYYIRAYAINAAGVSYGNLDSLVTLDYARVVTINASNLYNSTGVAGGNVLSDGGATVTSRGICWGTSLNPTISSYRTINGNGLGLFYSTMTGLVPNVEYHLRAYAINSVGVAYGEDKIFKIIPEAPAIITLEITDLTSISAVSGGNITSSGGASITKRGIIWSTIGDPLDDPSNKITNDGSGVGEFPSTLTNLLGNTTYYVRAYAVNAYGYAYGNLVVFTTPAPVIPQLSSSMISISNITNVSAIGTMNILNNGGAVITDRGICYSTDRINYTYVSSPTLNPSDIGTFLSTLTGLSANTTYYAKGYATNSAGTGYSSEISFITATLATLTTTPPSNVAGVTATTGGTITDPGNVTITARGVCYSPDSIPTYSNSHSNNGTGVGNFISNLTGLKTGTKYYIRAYAINSAGIAYGNLDSLTTLDYPAIHTLTPSSFLNNTATGGGNIVTDGGSKILSRGVCWSTSANPSIYSYNATDDSVGLGFFFTKMTGITTNVTYHVRAFARNSVGYAYGEDKTFVINPDVPLVETTAVSGVTSTNATGGGNVTSTGNATVTQRGIIWSANGDPTDDSAAGTTRNGTGAGSFSSSMTRLLGNTTYYVRAYATNSYGTSYGDIIQFKTPAPVVPSLEPTSLSITDITGTTANGTVNILSNGGAPVTARGVCYSTDQINYIYVPSATLNATDIGTYITNISGLQMGTVYYAKGYATNSTGTGYTNEVSFITADLVPITTTAPSSVTYTTAQSGGTITSTGHSIITAKGICWSIGKNPTYTLTTKTSDPVGTTGVGSYTSSITGLLPGVRYYVRAYAVNAAGVSYGNPDSLMTPASVNPSVMTIAADSITGNSARLKGEVLFEGGAAVTERGVCWGTSTNPTYDSNPYLSQGSGLGTFSVKATGLYGGVVYHFRAYAINSEGISYGDDMTFSTDVVPTLTTIPPTSVTNVSAISGGNITNDGGDPVTQRGVCWSTTPNPTITNFHTSDGAGTGSFTSLVTNLYGSSRYYLRAYAINTAGVAYGDEVSFTTPYPMIPTVKTLPVSNVSGVSAKGNGEIISNGGTDIVERGICWGIAPNPTIDSLHITSGNGNGIFSALMTGLQGKTAYHVRAYAISNVGIAYGEDITFSTVTTPIVITSDISSITGGSAVGGGIITSDGGAPVTISGVCWNTTGTPTVNSAHTTGSVGIGEFIHTLTGLKANTWYYVRAYATNSAGTTYGNVVTFLSGDPELPTLSTKPASSNANGMSGTSGGTIISNGGVSISKTGICWSTVPGFNPDTVIVNKTIQSDTTSFKSTLTGLLWGITYYVRAYATNSIGTNYGDQVSFTTFGIPTVTTTNATNITSNSAQSGGFVASDGGTTVTNSGICWNTTGIPSLSDSIIYNGAGTGTFTSFIKNLLGNTTYYVRAFATNSVGTAYGNTITFTTTPPVLATIVTTSVSITSATSAVGGGTIVSNGGAIVTTRGLYWSTSPNFATDTIHYNRTAETGYFVGSYTHVIKNLQPNTVYYVKAYVVNSAGIAYGDEVSFKTPALPTVNTLYANASGSTKAICGSQVADDGGSMVTSRGVMWSTIATFNPDTVITNKIQNGAGTGDFITLITGLKGNTTYYIRAYATNAAGTVYGNILGCITDPATLATLTTRSATNIKGVTATSGGNISDNGGEPVTTRGVMWSTVSGFRPDTVAVNKIAQTGSGIGNFTTNLAGLQPGTTYYIRAFAINSVGIAYGNELSFTTIQVPSVVSRPITPSANGTTASGGGAITSNGGANITNQGVCWSTGHNPTVSLYTKTSYDSGDSIFSSVLSGLSPATTYYVRAYAVNSLGVGYGDEISFTTPAIPPTLTTNFTVTLSKSSVATGGNITSDGGAAVTARGVIWSTDESFLPDTVTVNKTSDGTGIGSFTSVISNMNMSITYYIRAYATNSAGTNYGNQVRVTIFPTAPYLITKKIDTITGYTAVSGGDITSDGGADVTLKGLCWATHTNPTTSDYLTRNGSGTDSYSSTMTGLLPNTLYYVRAYAINKIGTAYGLERTVLTDGIPILTATKPATKIIATTATSGGEITDDGRSTIKARGVIWSLYSNPTVSLSTKTIDDTTTTIGSFMANMKGLIPETTYYVRAYATNAVGTGYGSQITFKTNAVILPIVTTSPHGAVDSTKAMSGGTVIDDGGMPVNVRGVCWSSDTIPTVNLTSKLNDSSGGLGSYTTVIPGLLPGTKYYIRAFATNSKGTGYGEVDSITTLIIPPTVSEAAVTNLKLTTGTASASLIATGGAPVTDEGFYWNTTGIRPVYPTPADSTMALGTNTSIFKGELTNLKSNTTYYIWAYATNSAGTRFSAVPTTFNTPSLPTVVTMTARSITKNTAVSGGTVVSDGGSPVLTRGVCYSPYGVPTTDSLYLAYSTGGTGAYSVTLKNLNPGTVYYVRAYAISALGTGYGKVDTMTTLNVPAVITLKADSVWSSGATSGGNVTYNGGGTLTVTSRGVCWSADSIPTVALTTKTINGSGLGSFRSTLSKLNHATKYYIRAYATNSVGTGYGQTDTITSGPVVPTLSIVALSSINDSTQLGATSVTDDGGASVTKRGICWGISENPTISNSFTINPTAGIGTYSDTIAHLLQGKTYYVRAYAINSAGTGYGPATTTKSCPSSFIGIHVAGFNGAPASKIVTYSSVSSAIGGSAQCWLTQNLGADQQASSGTDATEASAGWYWQFNRAQGYKHDGTTRIPSTAWITSINESAQWAAANDPCNLLLALGWRVPTSAELSKANGAPQNWMSIADGYNSVLKLHAAGMLSSATGALTNRGSASYYWSATQASTTNGYHLLQQAASSVVSNSAKATAMPLRCIRDGLTLSVPVVSNVIVPDSTQKTTSATAYATIVSDGGSYVTTRGFCWNTTGAPTIANNIVPSGKDKGAFFEQLTDLTEGATIYIRAYASNAQGTGYSPATYSFKICPASFDIIHTAGLNGAPVTKTVTYHSVSTDISGAPRCWLTQNLGADVQPSSVGDAGETAAGWYWQFNRSQGYKYDGTTRTPSNAYTSWITSINENAGWVAGSDPCNLLLGLGWRLPTYAEWKNAITNSGWGNVSDTYNSSLKLHMAGFLAYNTGIIANKGNNGYYWSSNQDATNTGWYLAISSSASAMTTMNKAYAAPVRCIRDALVKSAPIVSIVSIPDSAMTATTADGTATIASDGGALVTARGLCWSTTNKIPTTTDNIIPNGTGTGTFTSTIPDIQEGVTYYVRAYAINNIGTGYSPSVSTFKICPTAFDVIHTAGLNGAPVTKTVTYHSISTSISGAPVCWLTQNLGADVQPNSASDARETAAGWYWQFNRAQGYKHDGSTLTPSNAYTSWNTSINENSGWTASNDPCNLLLGLGWRLPSYAEWLAADAAPQYWQTAADTYNSVLNLHMAGLLSYGAGALSGRGSAGYYWSSNQDATNTGWFLAISSSNSSMTTINKASAIPVRCIRDGMTISVPSVSNVSVPTETMTGNAAIGTATVASSGGANVTVRGLVWSTTGTPTLTDSVIINGSGLGVFSTTIKNLDQTATYYVRAFASNSKGTGYSPATSSFKICPSEFSVIHTAGLNGAPVTKTVTYHSISSSVSGAARCWLTQNLGADVQPNAVTDSRETSAGWYWQFNRAQGYKYEGSTLTPSNAYTAWVSSINENSGWAPAADPCNLLLKLGWRLPTYSEWSTADAAPQFWQTATDVYNSVLNLHMAGFLVYNTGVIANRGSYGYYWSNNQDATNTGWYLGISSSGSATTTMNKAYAAPVRCIRDAVAITIPSVSDVLIPTATMTPTTAAGTATVASDGGATVTERGLCWSATNTVPTISDSTIPTGDGLGSFTSTIGGLSETYTYYVRAYAKNTKGIAYSSSVTSFKICPTEFSVIHTAGLNGAPVSKLVTYHSISSSISGSAKCWLTQNLGADVQPNGVSDARETAAGWYWQFNRAQGYKHDGTAFTPSNAYTAWNTSINENSGWIASNDPCNLLLGLGWRLPSYTEWLTADAAPQFWQTAADTYNSVLRLHMAGSLTYGAGALSNRGTYGYYWSSNQDATNTGWYLGISSSNSAMTTINKASALPVRCIRDGLTISAPTVSNVSLPTTGMTESTASGSATVASDGGAIVTARGLVWNTTGNPTTSDNVVSDSFVAGYGLGNFSDTITGLNQSSTYYVRAFATNSKGTSYSPSVTSFKICPSTFSIIHTAGLNGAPVTKTVTYHSISSNISGAARCWLTQNLGADQQPSAVDDITESSAGWYWQFNRAQGYKYAGSTLTPSNAYTAWVSSINENSGWAPAADPCNLLLKLGWRLPTYSEWSTADAAPQFWQTATDVYNSVLNLHMAGFLVYNTGVIANRGSYGYYWSNNQDATNTGWYLGISSSNSATTTMNKAYAAPVRCIRDAVAITIPSVSDVLIPTATMTPTTATGTATVASDGGATVTKRGLCWSTSNTTPTISDNTITTSDGLGSFTNTLSGLSENYTYYVRAYASNSIGTAYSPDVTSFKICPTEFTVIHAAGLNGAPVSKLVTYHSISANISGSAKCWLTQNLGADVQPNAVNDAREAAAGWYWQFNRAQGYKHDGSAFTPSNAYTAWNTSINENSGWSTSNDPCNLLLGLGWRLPSYAEWLASDAAPQFWQTADDAYNSVINLHMAGILTYAAGALSNRGSYGYYWSNNQDATNTGWYLGISSSSAMTTINKASALPVRCIRDGLTISTPTVSNVSVPTSGMTSISATGSATAALDGGATILERGLCWNTTGTPTISDNKIINGSLTGSFTTTITDLSVGNTYYVRAYAINSKGISYSPSVTSFKICPTTFNISHNSGVNGAPETKTVTYHSISSNISGVAKCWLTQNLGADQQPTSVSDNTQASAGWYWQFNRLQGYSSDGNIRTPSTSWIASINENSGWAVANDPCKILLGSPWRLPTYAEWIAADAPPQYWQTATDTYSSVLKLHMAGFLVYNSGAIANRGNYGYYWSSNQDATNTGWYLAISPSTSTMTTMNKAYAAPIRCIRD